MRIDGRLAIGAALVAALGAGVLGIAAASAQDNSGEKAPAAPKAGDAPATAPAPAPSDEDFAALVKALGDPDYAVRTNAYSKLAGSGPVARKALEVGARSEDAQIRWSARRLLQRLDEGGEARRRAVLRFSGGAPGTAPAPGGERRWDMAPLDDEQIRRAMEEMRRKMADLEREFQDLPGAGAFGPGGTFILRGGDLGAGERHVVIDRDGERTEVDVAADGKVSGKLSGKDADGKPKVDAFEAPNLDALKKDRPEVYEKVKDLLGDQDRFRFDVAPSLPRFPDVPRTGRLFRGPEAKPALGVTVSDVPPVLRTQLSLKEDEGIVVEEVVDGTPAARIGLRRHDVILGVNGIPVSSAEDVRAAVGAVKEGGDLRLRILRGGKVEEVSGQR